MINVYLFLLEAEVNDIAIYTRGANKRCVHALLRFDFESMHACDFSEYV